jgi:hypothetical protein
MLGDKAYDSAELREELDERGTRPVIPNRSNRKQPFRFSKRLYKLQNFFAFEAPLVMGCAQPVWKRGRIGCCSI